MEQQTKRILLVDDIEDNLKVLTDTLTAEGFAPLQARNGERAIEIARKAEPDLILLDIKMPGMDGYETISALKADPRTRDIPVIFLSALNQIEDKVRGFSGGAVDYISKPFQKEEVIARVSTHIKLRDALRQVEAERAKSENLLNIILPARVADELKKCGTSEPESFPDVSVLFSDFVNFTDYANNLSPKKLIGELNTMYSNFDSIMENNGCERIKTIGDAYLAVCSISSRLDDHATRMAEAAKQILSFLHSYNGTSATKWQIRIGLHCGEIVGGIVGTKKYIYDIFGDTVNIASRMESICEPMKITCTEAFARKIAHTHVTGEERTVEVKGKGPMTVYTLQ